VIWDARVIRYQLVCDLGHEFEGWFSSSADYERQEAAQLVPCAVCGRVSVQRAVMAPAVMRRDRGEPQGKAAELAALAAQVRAHVRDRFDYVGDRFADEARAIHDGDAPDRPIWGQANLEEARAMIEEGLPVAPLPEMFAPTPLDAGGSEAVPAEGQPASGMPPKRKTLN
jgi:hypothetical protein